MTPAEFRDLIDAAGLKRVRVAELLGVTRQTVTRWQSGYTPIGRAESVLIRRTIKPVRK